MGTLEGAGCLEGAFGDPRKSPALTRNSRQGLTFSSSMKNALNRTWEMPSPKVAAYNVSLRRMLETIAAAFLLFELLGCKQLAFKA